ncbi:MAG: DUF58 domain-containing protein [Phycisphaerae bacterium]
MRRPRPNDRPLLLLVLIAATAAAAAGVDGAFAAWCVAAVAVGLLGVAWPRLALLGCRVRLTVAPSRPREGDAVVLRLTGRRWLPVPLPGVRLECGRVESGLFAVGLSLPAAVKLDLAVPFTPSHFGVVPPDTLRLACGFPFGVWAVRVPVGHEAVVVWPAKRPGRAVSASLGEAASAAASRGSDGPETCGVRPWRRGDRLRQVHWPSSARTDQLIVRETRRETEPLAVVRLDTTGEQDVVRWREAVRQAAGDAEAHTRQGRRVCLVVAGGHGKPQEWLLPPGRFPREAFDRLSSLPPPSATPPVTTPPESTPPESTPAAVTPRGVKP